MKKIILSKMDEMIRVQAQLLILLGSLEHMKQKEINPSLTWMDAQEVMELFHLSTRTLLRLRSKGILPYYKLEGKIYYRKDELDILILKNQQVLSNRPK